MSSGDRAKDLLLLYRNIAWQYQLENYTDEALKSIQKALNLGRNELLHQIDMMDFRLPEGREHALLTELNDMTFGIQAKLTGNIQDAAAVTGEASYREYGNILSFDGKLAKTVGFNYVSVSPAQLRAMAVTVQVGGKLLEGWVKDTFEGHIIDDIHTAIMADNLRGVSTPQIIERMTDAFGMIERDAETLTRTYIASINNQAAADVYKANSDIIKKERWDSTFEVSTQAGSGTCMVCAALHGKEFPIDEDHIRPPKHMRCRCFMTPVTLSWRELGLDIDEINASLKPFTERDENRKILDAGQISGNFDDFLKTRNVKYQKGFFGENRYRMWKDGEIKVEDLIDKNGDLRLLKKDKDGNYVGLAASHD